MADTIRCPMCGKPNPADLDVCQFCGARLKPLISSSPDNSTSIKAGQQPVKKGTTEFEKVNPANQGSIHPGELPTKKNTAELERALPSWLRSLRGGQDEMDIKPEENAPAAEEDLPFNFSAPGLTNEPSNFLDGLNKASAAEEESVPDWLAGLRGEEKPAEAAAEAGFGGGPGSELGSDDWMSRLGNAPSVPSPESTFSKPVTPEKPADAGETTPDWLKGLQPSEPIQEEPAAPPAGETSLPDWFAKLPGVPAVQAGESESTPAEKTPDWLNDLEEKGGLPEPEAPAAEAAQPTPAEQLPDWLNQLQEKTPGPEPVFQADASAAPKTGGEIPDWLNQFEEKGSAPEPVPPAGKDAVPDWLSNLEPPTSVPVAASNEPVPDWLSNLEAQAGQELESTPALTGGEPAAELPQAAELPDWLSQIQPESTSAEPAAEAPIPAMGSEPLPEWLAGIKPEETPAAETPAFISEEAAGAPRPEEPSQKPFAVETPEWLSQVTPDHGAEKAVPGSATEPEQAPAEGGIQAAELPSWVQAMRPVESVVDQAKTPAFEENQVTERSGPLAGLVGVLPAGAGLGMSRKPPAYSVKLQIASTQQRYISSLEQIVSGETRPSALKSERQEFNRLWRWLIAALLILAVGIPFVFPGARMTPPTTLQPSDKGATTGLLNGISANSPVLVVFDYEPALAGELEMAAAPLIDQLQSKGARLALVSTSPTGPVLAERFLTGALLVNSHPYQNEQQYVDLGYIAGGPTGISLFASAPSQAMPLDANGHPAWSMPALQGVSKLSDFSEVIIVTSDADTGRSWIEQAGPYLGKTPMVMVISAQAEPMVQPYLDSGQLKGLSSGVQDAKSYEQSYSRPGLANHYWDSFSMGALIAELVIAFGAIWSALMVWKNQPRKPKEKA